MKDPQQSLIFLTNRVGRQLSRMLLEHVVFEDFEPQPTHLGLLADLITGDGQRQQDLAISSIKDKGTIARGLKQLEAAGLIRREVDAADRRQKRIYLTTKAHRMWQHTAGHAERAMCRARTDIAPADMAVCTKVLNQIYLNLQDQLRSASPQIPLTNEQA